MTATETFELRLTWTIILGRAAEKPDDVYDVDNQGRIDTQQEDKEGSIVLASNAIADPRTVMIKPVNTPEGGCCTHQVLADEKNNIKHSSVPFARVAVLCA